MIKFSAFADEISTDFDEQVQFLVNQNINYIEIRFVNKKNIVDLTKSERNEVYKKLTDNRLQLSAVASPIGKINIDKPFQPHFDKFKYAAEIAHELKAPFLRVFSYYPPEGESIDNYKDEVLIRMAKKADFLKGTNLILVHENESHIFGHNAQNCVEIIKHVNSPNLKLAYDPANFVWGDNIVNNIEVCWPLMKPYVVHIHIKDWKLGSKDIGCLPGEGNGQIPELLAELAKDNYEGFITLEPHLKAGGQYGGETGTELFDQAIKATKKLCENVGLLYN